MSWEVRDRVCSIRHVPLSAAERALLQEALEGNAYLGHGLATDPRNTTFAGVRDQEAPPVDEEVVQCIRAVPFHYGEERS